MAPRFIVDDWASERPRLRWALVLILLLALAGMTTSSEASAGMTLAAALPAWLRRVQPLQPYRLPVDPAEPCQLSEEEQAIDDLLLSLAIVGFALMVAAFL